MSKQLKNLQSAKDYSYLGTRLNAWFITIYALGFPKREFIHERFMISDHTKAKTTYYDLIRLLCLLFNVRVLRDDYTQWIYIVGRRNSVTGFKDYLDMIMDNIETQVSNEKDFEKVRGPGGVGSIPFRGGEHLNTYISKYRKKLIKDLYKEVQSILSLKKEFYLDKYAAIRNVRNNELYDQTFFSEYIKGHRLTHLKQFKCSTIN